MVDPERFGQLGSHGVERVEGGQRVLEDDREFGARHLAPLLAVGVEQSSTSAELGGAADDVGDRLQQADERGGGHRLAAAGFAQQRERFAAAGVEGHLVDGAHRAGDGADLDGQAVDVEDGFGVDLVDRRGLWSTDSGHESAFVVLVNLDRRFCGTVRRHR